MINNEKLQAVIAAYKEYFPTHWSEEQYKWEAVLHFRDHWDINAEGFASMFSSATEETANLLTSVYFYPRGMMISFAKADPEAVRTMFIAPYDEIKDLGMHVESFHAASEQTRVKYDDRTWNHHYQNTNTNKSVH